MDEFELIDKYFKRNQQAAGVVKGIGDDAAILSPPVGVDMLVSMDTQVSGTHFLPEWPADAIARKSVTVNVSDIAAMGGTARFVILSLTIPEIKQNWIADFAAGFHEQLERYNLTLIGGDTTRGPLSITLAIHGTVASGKAVRRDQAQAGDSVFVTGNLGAASLALKALATPEHFQKHDCEILLNALQNPHARTDFIDCLQRFATAAIDISDGLGADLNHICAESRLGALLYPSKIPLHPLLSRYLGDQALETALGGGDDYEMCFTVPHSRHSDCISYCRQQGLQLTEIGRLRQGSGLFLEQGTQEIALQAMGYNHF